MRIPFQLRIGCWETKNLAGVSHFFWFFALFFDTSFQSALLNFSYWNNTEKNGTFSLFETSVKETVKFAYIITFHFHSVYKLQWCYNRHTINQYWYNTLLSNHSLQQDSPHGRLLTCGHNSSVEIVGAKWKPTTSLSVYSGIPKKVLKGSQLGAFRP